MSQGATTRAAKSLPPPLRRMGPPVLPRTAKSLMRDVAALDRLRESVWRDMRLSAGEKTDILTPLDALRCVLKRLVKKVGA